MLPGKADAAMDLDAARRHPGKSLRAVAVSYRGSHRELVGVRLPGGRPDAVIRRGPRGLYVDRHVRAAVLDGLERSDRAPELGPDPRVLDGNLQHPLRAADLLGGQRDCREIPHPGQDAARVAARPEALRLGAMELDGRRSSGSGPSWAAVSSRYLPTGRRRGTGPPRLDRGRLPRGCRRCARQARSRRGRRCAPFLRSMLPLGPSDRGRRAARRRRPCRAANPSRHPASICGRRFVVGAHQRCCRQDRRGEERTAVQRTAEFFHRHAEIDEVGSRSAECLGNDQSLQPNLLCHPAPHGRVVAVPGLHGGPDGRLGACRSSRLLVAARSASCSALKTRSIGSLRSRRCSPQHNE